MVLYYLDSFFRVRWFNGGGWKVPREWSVHLRLLGIHLALRGSSENKMRLADQTQFRAEIILISRVHTLTMTLTQNAN